MIPSEQMATAESVVRDIEVRSVDGMILRGRWWRRHAPRGVVIVSHGFAEHGGCYRRVAEMLGHRLEFDVIAVDYRGHGRSPGRRGVVKRTTISSSDFASVARLDRAPAARRCLDSCWRIPMAGRWPFGSC